jgi:aminoglycoside phosphotransferase (APT) family kinase protein
VMAALAAHTDVPVPRMIAMEDDESVLGAPFFVMERIEGRIPPDSPPYTMEGWVTEITAAERQELWQSGLEAMAKIHRADWTTLGVDFLNHPEDGEPGLDQQLAYYDRYLEWAARGVPQPVTEATLAWIKAHRPPAGEPVGLVWGDARPGNMIFDHGECVAVLDWEMATLGNPAIDLGWWLFLDRHHTEGINVEPLDGVPARAETIARWEELTGLSAEHVDYYEVFAGLRFAIVMMRVAQMTIEYGVVPPDSDLETNNPVTQLLAKMLELPPPGALKADAGY